MMLFSYSWLITASSHLGHSSSHNSLDSLKLFVFYVQVIGEVITVQTQAVWQVQCTQYTGIHKLRFKLYMAGTQYRCSYYSLDSSCIAGTPYTSSHNSLDSTCLWQVHSIGTVISLDLSCRAADEPKPLNNMTLYRNWSTASTQCC